MHNCKRRLSLTVLAVIGATRRQRRIAQDQRQVPMSAEYFAKNTLRRVIFRKLIFVGLCGADTPVRRL
jgi:hypothetical protein